MAVRAFNEKGLVVRGVRDVPEGGGGGESQKKRGSGKKYSFHGYSFWLFSILPRSKSIFATFFRLVCGRLVGPGTVSAVFSQPPLSCNKYTLFVYLFLSRNYKGLR